MYLKKLSPIGYNYFECLYIRTKNATHSFFNKEHAAVRVNKVCHFRGNPRLITKLECEHTDLRHKCFQLYWKVLKNVISTNIISVPSRPSNF